MRDKATAGPSLRLSPRAVPEVAPGRKLTGGGRGGELVEGPHHHPSAAR